MMPQIGDPIPDVAVMTMKGGAPASVSARELLSGGTVVLFAVPGAFTPVCTEYHLPGFVQRLSELKARRVDTIACLAVNDPFVLRAWAREHGAEGQILMISDPDAGFTRAMNMAADASDFGLGLRSERYSAVIEDGVITKLNVEEHFTDHKVSTAEALLAEL
jgi:peroxiredoxin